MFQVRECPLQFVYLFKLEFKRALVLIVSKTKAPVYRIFPVERNLKTAIPISSVKPFKSKNRDKMDLDAPNPNLKKGYDRDFFATA